MPWGEKIRPSGGWEIDRNVPPANARIRGYHQHLVTIQETNLPNIILRIARVIRPSADAARAHSDGGVAPVEFVGDLA